LEDPNFKIYSASAGSGKTYALAKAYIKLLLANPSPQGFRQILALTFTNKAVEEMKTRILENLDGFGQDGMPQRLQPLFNELCQELALDAEALRQRSRDLLKRILHNYSFFEISTIDKFNHKIVRTFARDLQLSQNFEVEMDHDLLLGEAVGRLLERAGKEPELTRVLIDFSLEKLDQDKSWDISYDLMEIGGLIFKENHWDHLESLRSKSLADFKGMQKSLAAAKLPLETYILQTAQGVLQEIQARGFVDGDFPHGTLPKHFKKIMEGETDPSNLYTTKLQENLEAGKIFYAGDSRDARELSEFVLREFMAIKDRVHQLAFIKNAYGNLLPMTVLNEIAREIKNIELERELIPISSLNTILSKEIKGQPVPFIYERMGEKYRHYFIDEFQDTSKMQWENLQPLIANALSSENEKQQRGSLFLVGDVKQAIYRWRGGRAEGLLDLIRGTQRPFVVGPALNSLDTNWRSLDGIVEFNNDFFTTLAPVLENGAYRELYLEDSHQRTGNRPGGLVQMTFLDVEKDEKEATYCQHVLETIDTLLSKGHSHSDICVLVRKNKNGRLIADFLAENQVPIVSSEALLLQSDANVRFLISLLQGIGNPGDQEAIYQILLHLSKSNPDPHAFIQGNLRGVGKLLARDYGFDIRRLKGESVHNILDRAIVHFDLDGGSLAHISFLMDQVLDVEKTLGPGIHAFLAYWEIKKEKLSIVAPDGLDAVKILSVHKAKGLEFPFVIFPFANDQLDEKRMKKKIWVPTGPLEVTLGVKELLLNSKKELLEYSPEIAALYTDEEQKSVLDSINILYVALTRPVKGLYIITEKGKDPDSIQGAGSYPALFLGYLKSKGIPWNDSGIFRFGELPLDGPKDMIRPPGREVPYIARPKGDRGFVVSTRSGRLWEDDGMQAIGMGNLIQLALSRIDTVEDLGQALLELGHGGQVPDSLVERVGKKIREVVEHPDLLPYFAKGAEIMNEREILTPNGGVHRPDRIVLQGGRATLIDYKTGRSRPSHREQISAYARMLREMGLEVDHTILVYIDEKVETIFV